MELHHTETNSGLHKVEDPNNHKAVILSDTVIDCREMA